MTGLKRELRLDDLPEFCTLADLANVFPISKATLYRLAEQRQIPCIRIGRRIILSRECLKGWVAHELGMESFNTLTGVA